MVCGMIVACKIATTGAKTGSEAWPGTTGTHPVLAAFWMEAVWGEKKLPGVKVQDTQVLMSVWNPFLPKCLEVTVQTVDSYIIQAPCSGPWPFLFIPPGQRQRFLDFALSVATAPPCAMARLRAEVRPSCSVISGWSAPGSPLWALIEVKTCLLLAIYCVRVWS